ncbi:MAG: RNA-binding protein [Patescibacteria group bacterium]
MNNKVFVGSLSFNTSNQGLSDYFAQVGTVTSANVIMDKMTGKSKGFGFVEFATDAEAQASVDKLNNTELDGRTIFVDIARPSEKREGGNGGGGNRGGFNRERKF